MGYVLIQHPAFPNGVEVKEELLEAGREAELQQALVEFAASKPAPEGEEASLWDVFKREAGSSLRGIGEALSPMYSDEQKRQRYEEEFDARVQAERTDGSTAAQVAGWVLDPVTLPVAFLKAIKTGNIVTQTALRFGAEGVLGGTVQPVHEDFGDSRLFNTATAGLGATGIGAILGGVAAKFGVKTQKQLEELYNKADEAVKKEIVDAIEEDTKAASQQALNRNYDERLDQIDQSLEEQQAMARQIMDEDSSLLTPELQVKLQDGAAKAEEEKIKVELERIVADDATPTTGTQKAELEKNAARIRNAIRASEAKIKKLESKVANEQGDKYLSMEQRQEWRQDIEYEQAKLDGMRETRVEVEKIFDDLKAKDRAKQELDKIKKGEWSSDAIKRIETARQGALQRVFEPAPIQQQAMPQPTEVTQVGQVVPRQPTQQAPQPAAPAPKLEAPEVKLNEPLQAPVPRSEPTSTVQPVTPAQLASNAPMGFEFPSVGSAGVKAGMEADDWQRLINTPTGGRAAQNLPEASGQGGKTARYNQKQPELSTLDAQTPADQTRRALMQKYEEDTQYLYNANNVEGRRLTPDKLSEAADEAEYWMNRDIDEGNLSNAAQYIADRFDKLEGMLTPADLQIAAKVSAEATVNLNKLMSDFRKINNKISKEGVENMALMQERAEIKKAMDSMRNIERMDEASRRNISAALNFMKVANVKKNDMLLDLQRNKMITNLFFGVKC